jgi:tetratricopeptide (TPR) repeat protein
MYDESLTWSRRIINLGDKISPEERLATMKRMAVIFSKQAKLEESLETYQKALDECKTTLGDDHWLGKSILSEMGDLYLQMGSQTCAARDYQKTLDGLQRSLDKDDFRSLKILYRFAHVHLEQHRYQEALNLYIAVLDAVEGSSRRDEAAFTDLCNACVSDIATCHMKLFNTDLALSFLDRLVYCGDDEYRLGALVRIGNTQEKQGNYLAAIETYKQLLDLETAKVGASHRDPLMSVRKIAALYSRASKYQEALAGRIERCRGFGCSAATCRLKPSRRSTSSPASTATSAASRTPLGFKRRRWTGSPVFADLSTLRHSKRRSI